MQYCEYESNEEIMSTNFYIYISSDRFEKEVISEDIEGTINKLKSFQNKYSRFIENSTLNKVNNSTNIVISDELKDILNIAKKYHKLTNGIFDPTVHNVLIKKGYSVSKNKGFIDEKKKNTITDDTIDFSQIKIKIDTSKNWLIKPSNLRIDLGGIGKGYMIDIISATLKKRYSDFCVSIGGDMYLSGRDTLNNYDYWAIEIENPFEGNENLDLPTLMIKNLAIATSGVNKRKWLIDNNKFNHIINPTTKNSVDNELLSVTLIGESAVFADIYAKTLLIMGLKRGLEECVKNDLAAIFITINKEVYMSDKIKEYVWKE